ncbi:DNA/RNA helicase domain-containing protein, partial [Kitasatospora sp. NPDC058263]
MCPASHPQTCGPDHSHPPNDLEKRSKHLQNSPIPRSIPTVTTHPPAQTYESLKPPPHPRNFEPVAPTTTHRRAHHPAPHPVPPPPATRNHPTQGLEWDWCGVIMGDDMVRRGDQWMFRRGKET